MRYVQAMENDIEQIYKLVQDTINEVYPRYYPSEVVSFFSSLHSEERILEDIKSGYVWSLFVGDLLVGTGSFIENHITRVFVLPDFQGNGYGTFIMQSLEKMIGVNYESVILDASLSASQLYEKLGYRTQMHNQCNVENGAVLVYEVMEKFL